MHYQEFVSRVNERIQAMHPGEAEYAIQATLSTLGEHLSGPEAEAFLASRLPAELEAQLASGNYARTAKNLSSAEFYRRAGAPGLGYGGEHGEARALALVEAVLEVLSEAAGGAESAEVSRRTSPETALLSNT